MPEPLYVTVIRVSASLAACVLFASLLPDIRVVRQQKSTTSMPSPLPVLSMLANCVAWGFYGLLINDYFPLVATNIVGLLLSLYYLIVYYQNEKYKKRLRFKLLATSLMLLGLILYPYVAAMMGVENDTIQDTVGSVSVIISSVMFGSPLVLVKRVIQERNVRLLPMKMIIAGAVNCVLWLAFGLLIDNLFVIVPNAANLLLGVMQILLYCVLPRLRTYDTVKRSASESEIVKKAKKGGETAKSLEEVSIIVDTEDEPSSADEELSIDSMISGLWDLIPLVDLPYDISLTLYYCRQLNRCLICGSFIINAHPCFQP